MKLQRMILPALTLMALIAGRSAHAGSTFVYTSFDPPVGVDSSVGDSYSSGIANNGVIIGTYIAADATYHGYELQNGVYTYFDAPNAGTGNYNGTISYSVVLPHF